MLLHSCYQAGDSPFQAERGRSLLCIAWCSESSVKFPIRFTLVSSFLVQACVFVDTVTALVIPRHTAAPTAF